MSNPFDLSRDHRSQPPKKELATIPFDSPDVIKPSRLISSQNTTRRRTMTGADMLNSQPLTSTPTSNLKRNRLENPDILDNVRYKEPRLYENSEEPLAERLPPVENPLYLSQEQYRSYPREEYNIYDHQSSQTELREKMRMLQSKYDTLLRNYTKLYEVQRTEADQIAERFRLNEEHRDEAYAQLQKAVMDLRSIEASGNEGPKILVERLQEENKMLQEQLRKQSQRKDPSSANNLEEMNSTLALYEGLTSVKVVKVRTVIDGELFECVANGKLATHTFSLFFPTDKGRLIEYTPTSENTQLLSTILPDFLLEDINFSRDNLPLFFWRLSSSLHPKS